MPFQSEKQRRYLHANHPEIAKRWERDYATGGILDINESEEIIDDGGNEIELTDYNAAFDDPNDLSTGVKSLFQAKDGGTPRRSYFTGAYGVGGTENTASTSGGNGGYQNVHQTGAVTQTPGRITTTTPDNDGWSGDVEEDYKPPGWEQKDKQELVRLNLMNVIDKNLKTIDPKKYYKDKYGKLATGAQLIETWWSMPKTPVGMLTFVGTHLKINRDIKKVMEEAEQIGLAGGPPGTNDPLYDQLWLHLEKQKSKYKKDDDTGDDGPPLTIGVLAETQEEVEEAPNMISMMDRIRAGQAKRSMLVDKGIIQDSPIVDESVTDITTMANKGGLANLFRVKKQQQEKNMRNDFGTRPYKSRFPYDKGGKSGSKKQGYDARLDESLGARRGAESTKSQSFKARRDESKGAEKAAGKRAYSAVGTMDK